MSDPRAYRTLTRGRPRRPFRIAPHRRLPAPGGMTGRLFAGAPTAAARRVRARTAAATTVMRRRRNPMRRQVVRHQGGSTSFSQFALAKRADKRVSAMKKIGAPNFYLINASDQLQVPEGFQGSIEFPHISLEDLQSIAAKVPDEGAPGIPAPKRYVLESCQAEFLITNSSLASMYVDIYDIVRKRDVGKSPTDKQPLAAWQSGLYWESGGDTNAVLAVNSVPTDSEEFKQYFKVVQRKHIGLPQGASHRHMVRLRPNRLIDTSLLNSLAGDPAGLTCYTMIVAYGQPVSVPKEGAVYADVTTASGAIDVVRSLRYKFTWIAEQSTRWTFVDGLVSLGTEKVVSQGAGMIVDNDFV